jgi:hypothetical protein
MKRMMIFLSLALMVTSSPALAEEFSRQDVAIGASGISMPAGRVILIKREAFRGAMIFGETEERPEGFFAKYKSYRFGRQGIQNFDEGEVIFKRVSSGGFLFHKGIGNSLGPPLKFDNFSLCVSPAGSEPHLQGHAIVYFWYKPTLVDQKIYLAPTPWKKVEEADPDDSRVKWYAYDEKREPIIIPIDKIWH